MNKRKCFIRSIFHANWLRYRNYRFSLSVPRFWVIWNSKIKKDSKRHF